MKPVTIQSIFGAIKDAVCSNCIHSTSYCKPRSKTCYAAFDEAATEIYWKFITPLQGMARREQPRNNSDVQA